VREVDIAELREQALILGISLSPAQLQQFERYMKALTSANTHMNLTAIVEESEIVRKHFLDSLFPLRHIAVSGSVVDVGTGAGFPGLPMAIARPDLKVTLVDSLNKRVRFLCEVIEALELGERVSALAARAEDVGRDPVHREAYDLCISRAVAGLNVLAEYCLPLTKVGGYFVAMKGPRAQEELVEAQQAVSVLGGTLREVKHWNLPGEGEQRTLVVVEKTRPTPGMYPRRAGMASKKPL
jgi:16S rRNA (guanine527-N7)-methyltransferase